MWNHKRRLPEIKQLGRMLPLQKGLYPNPLKMMFWKEPGNEVQVRVIDQTELWALFVHLPRNEQQERLARSYRLSRKLVKEAVLGVGVIGIAQAITGGQDMWIVWRIGGHQGRLERRFSLMAKRVRCLKTWQFGLKGFLPRLLGRWLVFFKKKVEEYIGRSFLRNIF
jgi:hypothetical protein